jgi:hypothetical protein
MTQDFEEAIDEWDDILEEAPPASEVETGSELDEAIRRKAIAERESGIVPPHGPRAYKRKSDGVSTKDIDDVDTDEVLFDDAADWRAQPTMRIMVGPPEPVAPPTEAAFAPLDSKRSSSMILIGALIAAVVVIAATVFYASEQDKDAKRLEQQIRMQLEASE